MLNSLIIWHHMIMCIYYACVYHVFMQFILFCQLLNYTRPAKKQNDVPGNKVVGHHWTRESLDPASSGNTCEGFRKINAKDCRILHEGFDFFQGPPMLSSAKFAKHNLCISVSTHWNKIWIIHGSLVHYLLGKVLVTGEHYFIICSLC